MAARPSRLPFTRHFTVIPTKPKLRRAQRFAVQRDEESLVGLRDPFGLAQTTAIDADFAPLLDLLDGGHTLAQISQSLQFRHNVAVDRDNLNAFVEELAAMGWLEGVAADRAFFADERPCGQAFADILYPGDREILHRTLQAHLGPPRQNPCEGRAQSVCGVLVPHHPFDMPEVGWQQALGELPDPQSIDVVVLVATDFAHQEPALAILNEPLTTVFGAIRSPSSLMQRLEHLAPQARAHATRARLAPGLELALTGLHFHYGESMPPVLPLLCGRLRGDMLPQVDQGDFGRTMAALTVVLNGRRAFFVGAAELRHGGPIYDGSPNTPERRQQAREGDEACLRALSRGQLRDFLRSLRGTTGEIEVNGALTLLTLMHLLPVEATGVHATYAQVSLANAPNDWAGTGSMRFCIPSSSNCSSTS